MLLLLSLWQLQIATDITTTTTTNYNNKNNNENSDSIAVAAALARGSYSYTLRRSHILTGIQTNALKHVFIALCVSMCDNKSKTTKAIRILQRTRAFIACGCSVSSSVAVARCPVASRSSPHLTHLAYALVAASAFICTLRTR